MNLGHRTVGSNDLEAAKTFYDALLGSAGITPMVEHPSGGRAYGNDGNLFFVVPGPYDGRPATVGNGSMHGFRFDMREEVDAFHVKALALGGTGEGALGERTPKFYMSYFRDLDGNCEILVVRNMGGRFAPASDVSRRPRRARNWAADKVGGDVPSPPNPPSFIETNLLWRPRIHDGGFGGTGTVHPTLPLACMSQTPGPLA